MRSTDDRARGGAAPTLEQANEALHSAFGYERFRPGQEQAVRAVLEGRDTLVILPTGGGKSLCYQVPALLLPGLTVVVSPLISLMKDQVDALTARGLPAAFINSTLTGGQVADRLSRAARGEIKLLYVAPERFDQGTTAERLRAMGVSLLAVDEAHCVSEWGHDFRPSYLRMASVRARLGDPPTIALTATATPEVRRDIAHQLHLDDPVTVITGFDRHNLRYHVVPTKTEGDKDAALADVLRTHEGLAIVYASTRKAVERISAVLERARIPAVAYHAGLDDAHRHDVQDAFMNEDVRVIVATNAFGMGIDKANVRLVVHHAMPGTLEAYYQEAGRAGRDGKQSDCFLLHAFQDRFTHEFFIKGANPERKLVEQVYEALRRRADSTGIVRVAPEDLVASLPAKTSPREVEAALRILARGDALRSEADSASRVFVRLLATPERIKRELNGDHDVERELLRALWRAVGKKLNDGAAVDLEGLPPGFGGASQVIPVLEGLQARQFVVWERSGGGTRLTSPRAPLSSFAIDWASIDRRRLGDLSKLEAMQKYAYAPGCRRAFVLRYFGDPAARPACQGCDNCLGLKHEAPPSSVTPRPKPARRRTAAERFGGASAGGGESRALPTSASASGAAELVMGAEDAGLFAELKRLRGAIAREEQVPAYVVFPDRTLAEIAVRRPRSLAALAEVRGVGPAKLDKYGERFLDAVRNGDGTEAA
ncbi:MAG: RecQ family ATP-dependent DNA helicase [Gemmatimonadaceae bacterium]